MKDCMQKQSFDIVVIGAGHAGVEASLAAARTFPTENRPRSCEWRGFFCKTA